MNYRVSKLLKIAILIAFLFPTLWQKPAYALECTILLDTPPSLAQLLCPVRKAFNIVLLSVGAVFSGVALFAAIKFAMAQGDAKAVMGAQQTFTYAVIGVLVVVGVFVITSVSANIFGLNSSFYSGNTPFDDFESRMNNFLNSVKNP
ncbi:MAG: hypothetical protein UX44_C0007G0013 [candidate division WWE3 bacterium GW2011_GWA1_46_21]|uniref:Uncharacterized protein n=3 Tax=Katanobacteria TaxID=422282 RepID=A0A0G1PEH2_UNCKA|nr:MAG: hypothetical protein UX44_C0007G0013 [candidate division WWE3 bacterium GW2011_GWA1_46_21]KKU50802.1 MAG: hypothetical protein UX73_C0014G0009 [candidate division WWE3 bacterium GW2011_GWC1_47_10]KKU57580.1 MAG: hypothetical protein UX79_C0008G0014 [candidate division WWE3 bacterium GW2011_GWB1_47_11]